VSQSGTRERISAAPGRVSGPAVRPTVVVIGNPNVGKTTLYNRLTGQNARVGNYPGVTVERRTGMLVGADSAIEVIDVPGAYSLSARSAEEQIAIHSVLGLEGNPRPQLAVVVIDAGQLVRNLYLVVQLLELQVPVVIALNMIDEVGDQAPEPEAIRRLFGVPCVPTSARRGDGIDALIEAIQRGVAEPPRGHVELPYPAEQRATVDRIAEALPPEWRSNVERDRALARWALMSVEPDDELTGIDPGLRARCLEVQTETDPLTLDRQIIEARYRFLDEHAPALYAVPGPEAHQQTLTDRVDRLVIHPVWGFAFFLGVMTLLFQSLFTWADPAIGLIEDLIGRAQGVLTDSLPEGLARDLLVEGLLGGVGNVVVFLPQILLLFFFVGLLEDSGYMARVAYLMDRIMRALGLHGRAFVPMLSGFACAIPAILATRTMERQRDRLLTMMVIPLMTCSARLPVYTLIIAALFPPTRVFGALPVQGLLMVGMYVFATLVALIATAVLSRTVIRGRRVPLILELPPYRLPKLETTLRMMWDRARVFLTEAGTIILACTIVLWTLLSFPRLPEERSVGLTEAAAAAVRIEQSYGGRFGHAIEPAIAPLGFDWKIGVGLVGAFAAREVFISTMGIVYGVGTDDEEMAPLRDRMRAETRADGAPAYRPLVGLSLMVFFALACQCMSTLAVVRRETRSWKWPAFLFAYMTALAWLASFLVYQGGTWLGF
jgi:ferrous iron transport protein B